MKEKKGKLKSKKVYKRARNVATISAIIFCLIFAAGIGLGIYSSVGTRESLDKFKETNSYTVVHINNIRDINQKCNEGILTKKEGRLAKKNMNKDNYTYLGNCILKSDSEYKDEYEKNYNLFLVGLGGLAAGLVGATTSGIIACKKDDEYEKSEE